MVSTLFPGFNITLHDCTLVPRHAQPTARELSSGGRVDEPGWVCSRCAVLATTRPGSALHLLGKSALRLTTYWPAYMRGPEGA